MVVSLLLTRRGYLAPTLTSLLIGSKLSNTATKDLNALREVGIALASSLGTARIYAFDLEMVEILSSRRDQRIARSEIDVRKKKTIADSPEIEQCSTETYKVVSLEVDATAPCHRRRVV